MANKIVLADTSILIDLFRKSEKANSRLVQLALQGYEFHISAITEYEVYQEQQHCSCHFGMTYYSK